MEQYVIDTHALLWYLAGDARISKAAKEIIQKCEAGEFLILAPSIVLIESIEVINKRRIIYPIGDLFKYFENNPQFEIKPLDLSIIGPYRNYKCPDIAINLESHDKIIIVTSVIANNAPILTKDAKIQKVHPTIW